MQNITLIPAWRRDDFLQVTLDYIKEATGADRNLYVFLVDRGFHTEVVEVIKSFPLEKLIRFAPQHRYRGNSYNLLEGYKYALQLAKTRKSELIYLVEEDIWVGKDFFDYHEKVQSQFPCFCASAVRNQNDDRKHPDEPESVYYHMGYQSLGVSFKLDSIAKIVEHATPALYQNMLRYVKTHFPNSKYGNMWTEQDGVINRIAERNPVHSLYCYSPRAYHAGFVGYNRRGTALEGSREARVAKLRSMSDKEMNDLAGEYKDITRCNLDGYSVDKFVLR